MRSICILLLVACAPSVPSPREQAAVADLGEAALLDQQLRAIPGVTSAHAAIHRAFVDPLTGAHAGSATTVLILIDGKIDRGAIEYAAHALAPSASLAIVKVPSTEPSAPRHGPELLIVFVAILAIALFVAWRSRPTA